jgi:hypothetical protein
LSVEEGIADGLLVLGVVLADKLLAFCGNVHPKTAFAANGAGTFNDKADLVGGIIGWWKVDVLAANVWRAVVAERQEVDGLRLL